MAGRPRQAHHGEAAARTPEYRAWTDMIGRCHNTRNARFMEYGGRGIRVCRRWRASFTAFLADVGRRPSEEHSLDRIDNDRGYTPKNVRWATRCEQQDNKRTTVHLSFRGETHNLSEWARRTGLSVSAINMRVRNGWSVEEALTTPTDVPRTALGYTLNGKQQSVRAWAVEYNVPYTALLHRLKAGWPFETALKTPVSRSNRRLRHGT